MLTVRFPVRGVQYRPSTDLTAITLHSPVWLVPEPGNEHDPDAIQILAAPVDDREHYRPVGYVARDLTGSVRRLLILVEALAKIYEVDLPQHGRIDWCEGTGSAKALRVRITLDLDLAGLEQRLGEGFADVVVSS